MFSRYLVGWLVVVVVWFGSFISFKVSGAGRVAILVKVWICIIMVISSLILCGWALSSLLLTALSLLLPSGCLVFLLVIWHMLHFIMVV